MKNKQTITIGIPAHNEEKNISFLLKDILGQKLTNSSLVQINVVSDGSTDMTAQKVNEVKDKRIKFIETKTRKGLAETQNNLISQTHSDIFVLLHADIRLPNNTFIQDLINPIVNGKADLVVPSVREMVPQTFFEKILYVSTVIKNAAYKKMNGGKNVYTARGIVRAFSKPLYKKLHFPFSIGEDAYSYFFCIENNFQYMFLDNLKVVFRLPNNYEDHKLQSLRFFNSQTLQKKYFNKNLVEKQYKLPKKIMIESVLKNFLENPIYTFLYILVLLYLKFQSFFMRTMNDKWVISKSSKLISHN